MVEVVHIDLLSLLLVLSVAWVFGALAERVGYPTMMGELFAGIAFGPALLGLLHPSELLSVLSELGVFLLMVYVGMEVDLRELFELGPQALLIAFGAFVIPFGLGYAAGIWLGISVGAALFLGLAMAATSLATKSRILADLDLLETRIANVLLGGALASDVGVLIAYAGVDSYVTAGGLDPTELSVILLKALGFFAVTLVIGYRFLPLAWRYIEGQRERYGFVNRTTAFTFALLVSLLFAQLATLADLHMIIGGFIAGMFLRQADVEPGLYEHIHMVIYDLAMGLFAPVFFVTIGFQITFDVFADSVGILVVLVAIAFLGKIVGSWLFSLPTSLTSREGLVVGFGMNGRGTVEIIIAGVAYQAGVIDQSLFSILVFIAIFTTALVPVTVTWGVQLLERADELVYVDSMAPSED
ncbi:cation:proton antiporter [Natrinema hispanicum]|uniref:Kef-type K+ transport system, membrane component KefB n=1 Tax=Natrinema hispanicum TaxID=392421 RepID=A0A1G6Q5W0_9EURY|nr:cation:proton antiporter [Natrinema hispanicum]SDC87621.1 Kef-type K+ transport system, membrane component KefB [Natrinema hispanicum]SET29822.1 Kef-type K+ transport system, membrane component KefB [Natrinema hispanicum]